MTVVDVVEDTIAWGGVTLTEEETTQPLTDLSHDERVKALCPRTSSFLIFSNLTPARGGSMANVYNSECEAWFKQECN